MSKITVAGVRQNVAELLEYCQFPRNLSPFLATFPHGR